MYYEYTKDDETDEKQIFIQRNHKIIKLEYDSNVFFDDIIKSIKNKYVDLDKEVKGNVFSFKFVSELDIRCSKVNKP